MCLRRCVPSRSPTLSLALAKFALPTEHRAAPRSALPVAVVVLASPSSIHVFTTARTAPSSGANTPTLPSCALVAAPSTTNGIAPAAWIAAWLIVRLPVYIGRPPACRVYRTKQLVRVLHDAHVRAPQCARGALRLTQPVHGGALRGHVPQLVLCGTCDVDMPHQCTRAPSAHGTQRQGRGAGSLGGAARRRGVRGPLLRQGGTMSTIPPNYTCEEKTRGVLGIGCIGHLDSEDHGATKTGNNSD
ncbi:hypothetical protein GGX14DRAFT_394079 [Mycena pura]|uniref:Uncharacterized protein n=1 Tax=Mycena pura TaxID=153505 RepID=A0AAD6VJV9_9AGAR|nr:hypothetical protein GGX14DRAFT_394079 [Mycena pura]